ncbi:unnamed protein product [Ambrosiozyma monospora]|uniref:Unnamed protein product n=1 Tax=Ambrosiozyma monospora TaxID=43982 RepID=A0ACB5SY52_AMBMO|nr:unnamed protein product [Ambrosiozyma monospora]
MGQFLGVLTAGLIASSTYDSLNGVNGLSGWRWMYLIDGIMSSVVAILALLFIPGTPFNPYSLWLTDDEIILARQRMHKNGSDSNAHVKAFFDKSTWKTVATSWQVYFLSFINMLGFNTNNASSGSFTLWLKSLDKWSVGRVNQLGTIAPGLGMVYIIIVCFGADITRKRFAWISFSFIMTFLSNIILSIWDVPYGAKWFGFCSGYWAWSQSSVFNPMISDFFRRDNNVRSIAWTIIYVMGNQSSVWIGRLIWPTVDQPKYHKGFTTCAAFSIGFAVLILIAYIPYKRDERREALLNGIYIYNSKHGEAPDVAGRKIDTGVQSHKDFSDKESESREKQEATANVY